MNKEKASKPAQLKHEAAQRANRNPKLVHLNSSGNTAYSSNEGLAQIGGLQLPGQDKLNPSLLAKT